jgi:hypothetical protein
MVRILGCCLARGVIADDPLLLVFFNITPHVDPTCGVFLRLVLRRECGRGLSGVRSCLDTMTCMRRTLRLIAVFGALGVVMSYSAAWTLAYRSGANEVVEYVTDVLWGDVDAPATEEERAIVSAHGWNPHEPSEGFGYRLYATTFRLRTEITVFHEEWESPEAHWPHTAEAIRMRSGWPLRSTEHWRWRSAGRRDGEVWGSDEGIEVAVVGRYIFPGLQSVTWLPLRPLWISLTINSAFYGALLWVIWFTPGAMKRSRRRRRGRCVKCGYDLRGRSDDRSACPECGAAMCARPKASSFVAGGQASLRARPPGERVEIDRR